MESLAQGSSVLPGPATSRPISRLTTLPTELLDLIAFHVGTGLNGRSDLRSLLFTSKALVPSALRMLYRQPLAVRAALPLRGLPERAKSYSLRNALVKYPGYARAVRDLSKLHFLVSSMLNRPTTIYSSAIDQAVEPWSWQEDIIRLCIAATSIGLILRDGQYASSVGKHLADRHMTDISIDFPLDFPRSSIHAVVRDFAKALGGVSMPRINHLTLAPPGVCHVKRDKKPHYNKLWAMRALELSNVPRAAISSNSLIKAFSGNALTELTWLPATSNYGAGGPKEEYQSFCAGQVLPRDFFALFPHLQRLNVSSLKEMDVEKLSTLAKASPNLRQLAFTSCFWSFTHTDFANTHPSLSRAETGIVDALGLCKKLKSVDLGIHPFTHDDFPHRKHDADCRCGLRQYAKSRKIKLYIQGCPSREELESTDPYDTDDSEGTDDPDDWDDWDDSDDGDDLDGGSRDSGGSEYM